jgi:hypothetical protein
MFNGFAEKKTIEGEGTDAACGEHAPYGPNARWMQQLRQQGHAPQGLPEMRILQRKADPEARGDFLIHDLSPFLPFYIILQEVAQYGRAV